MKLSNLSPIRFRPPTAKTYYTNSNSTHLVVPKSVLMANKVINNAAYSSTTARTRCGSANRQQRHPSALARTGDQYELLNRSASSSQPFGL